VAIAGSTTARTASASAALAGEGGVLRAYQADLATAAGVDDLLARVRAGLGPIAVLVNGAGINFNRATAAITEAEFDRVMAVNVKAAFFVTRAVATTMQAGGIAGRIINITSGNYRYARPDAGLYCATKAALEMLTRAFAIELGAAGIAVNAVAPGLVARQAGDERYQRVARYYQAHSALSLITTGQDVAAAVLFLASAAARAISGETIVVDAGYSAGRLDFPPGRPPEAAPKAETGVSDVR
jgi:NAD(P)-dependent dehydrogenase (short-subunit alcohol dehydrogenase family)